MGVHIAVLSPDQAVGPRISALLRNGGYRVTECSTLASLIAVAEAPDDPVGMVVLASSLTDEAAQAIRAVGDLDVPLLLVLSSVDEAGIVRALRLGADGCLTEPFGQAELLARVEAHLRRHWQWGLAQRRPAPEEVVVDAIACAATVDGREVRLTPTEYRLLSRLAQSEGEVVPNDELCTHIWGLDRTVSPGSLRLYISHLRRKLEQDPRKPRLIRTKWGVGYYLQGRTLPM